MHDRHNGDLRGRTFRRILLLKPSSLGDVVHALPVLHGLRKRFPEAAIDWLIATPFASFLENEMDLTEVILFDRHRYARLARSPRVSRDFLSFARNLRARRYDLTIDLQGLFRTGFLSRVTGAAVRIGFRAAREGAWIFYSHHIRTPDPEMHAVDKNYLVADMLGFADTPPRFDLKIPETTHDSIRQKLSDAGVRQSTRVALVVPGARWETKRWPVERFAETIDHIQSDSTATCILAGGPDEVELCAGIASLCQTNPIDLSGTTTIPELAALIDRADVVLCQDSAAAHLAVACGSALVCLTGPTNPRRTGPYGRLADVQRMDIPCSPCYFRRLSQCGHNHRCMQDLTTSRIVMALRKSLHSA
ncbi:MAG: glycosyltransferase family 9 protein [Planctomycetes bacterium]|nr:glycosyltransferase family 9 protein [Planctomycetota bacterium]